MPELIYLPYAGETVTEGRIMKWDKDEGDTVKKDEKICEVMTSKLSLEVYAPKAGMIFKIFAPVDELVPIGKVIAVLQLEGEELSEADIEKITDRYIPKNDTSTTKENTIQVAEKNEIPKSEIAANKVKISPVAKRIAEEIGVDISKVKGTGPNGRIVKEDIIRYEKEQKEAPEQIVGKKTVEKLTGVRSIIAQRLRESVVSKPHVNFQTEVNMDSIIELRNTLNSKIENKISINSFVLQATVKALKESKYINANLIEDQIVLFDDINIGMAVAREDKGLIVPVIKYANRMSLYDIDVEAKRLAELAREDKLSIEQISGGTFTVSNLGMYGIKNFNAIINPPEVGILAVSSITKKPVVVNGEIVVANIMNINLAVDHSVVDGSTACEFVMNIKDYLETPYLLFI